MKNIIIAGPMASGKSTIAKVLAKKYGLKNIVTYTTRPMRPNEKNHIDYNFLTLEEFNKLDEEHFFAETASYNASFGYCRYGSAKESYCDNSVIVLNPIGVKTVKNVVDSYIVYLNISEKELLRRLKVRGDKEEEIIRRLEADRKDFKDFEKYASIIYTDNDIFNGNNLKTPEEIADMIIKKYHNK